MHSEEIHSIMRDLRIVEEEPPELTLLRALHRLERLSDSVSVGGHLHRIPKGRSMKINIVTKAKTRMNLLYHIEQAIYEGRFPS